MAAMTILGEGAVEVKRESLSCQLKLENGCTKAKIKPKNTPTPSTIKE